MSGGEEVAVPKWGWTVQNEITSRIGEKWSRMKFLLPSAGRERPKMRKNGPE